MRWITTTLARGLIVASAMTALACGVFATPAVLAQFESGSTGVNGPFPPGALPEGTEEILVDLRDGGVTYSGQGGTLGSVVLPATPDGGFGDGIFHFTSVNVPAGTTVRFVRHLRNPPIYFLAQENVIIAGTVDVSGEDGGAEGVGGGGSSGPGGYKGGHGGLVGSNGGGQGLGPGGGAGGGVRAGPGSFGDSGVGGSSGGSYGSTIQRPLLGGSGGAGARARNSTTTPGATGGGGGGAIAIASSAGMQVTGQILADGGDGGDGGDTSQGDFFGGAGSGGGILLTANTLSGSGLVSAMGGSGRPEISRGGRGRIRLESFLSTLNLTNVQGVLSVSAPGPVFVPNPAVVRIESIDGVEVPDAAAGGFGGTDVVVDQPGTVSVAVRAANIEPGTRVRVTAKFETTNLAQFELTPGLTGTVEDSTASVDVDLPFVGLYFFEARVVLQ